MQDMPNIANAERAVSTGAASGGGGTESATADRETTGTGVGTGSSEIYLRSRLEALEYIRRRYPWLTHAIGNGDPKPLYDLARDILFEQ